jgi:hypothetical protein
MNFIEDQNEYSIHHFRKVQIGNMWSVWIKRKDYDYESKLFTFVSYSDDEEILILKAKKSLKEFTEKQIEMKESYKKELASRNELFGYYVRKFPDMTRDEIADYIGDIHGIKDF